MKTYSQYELIKIMQNFLNCETNSMRYIEIVDYVNEWTILRERRSKNERILENH